MAEALTECGLCLGHLPQCSAGRAGRSWPGCRVVPRGSVWPPSLLWLPHPRSLGLTSLALPSTLTSTTATRGHAPDTTALLAPG